jgi:hypothetical protein
MGAGSVRANLKLVVRQLAPLLAPSMLLLGVVLLACAGGGVEMRTYSQRFDVDGAVELMVNSQSGRVVIKPGSEDAVVVEALLRDPDRVELEVRQEGNRIEIEVVVAGISITDVAGFRVDRGADLTITAPQATAVEIKTLTGAIDLNGLTLGGSLETGSGGIRLQALRGSYKATTGRGELEVSNFAGALDAASGSGGVVVESASGQFNLKTAYGRFSFEGSLAAGGSNHLESGDGRVIVTVSGAADLSLDIRAAGVRLMAPVSFTASTRASDHIQGTSGSGATVLMVRAGNGTADVTLRE